MPDLGASPSSNPNAEEGRNEASLSDERRMATLAHGNERRLDIVALRRNVKNGNVDVRDLLTDPPDSIQHMTLIAVMSIARSRPSRPSVWMTNVGRKAARDGINLLQPVSQASTTTRLWCCRNCASPRAVSVARRAAA